MKKRKKEFVEKKERKKERKLSYNLINNWNEIYNNWSNLSSLTKKSRHLVNKCFVSTNERM